MSHATPPKNWRTPGITVQIGRRVPVLCLCLLVAVAPQVAANDGPDVGRRENDKQQHMFKTHVVPFIKKYCIQCHGADDPQGGVALHRDTSHPEMLKARKKWRRVLELLEFGAMPPVEADRHPTTAERQAAVKRIENALYHIDCTTGRDPGRVTIRRLNRAEYNNTIRDLLGVDFRPAADFPLRRRRLWF